VNANPSGSRTPPTGCRGILEARREFAVATGPSQGLAPLDVRAVMSGRPRRRTKSSNGGSRHAKMVCRGALNLRRTAQGRVGDELTPRHVASHLVPQLLLSARSSASADTVRLRLGEGAMPRLAQDVAARSAASRPQAQPGERLLPVSGSRGANLVSTGADVTPASACAQSRGKGVLAA
jgi:hypothetical protein